MRFLIVTPSYRQLQWLRLCVASVKDQSDGDSDFSIEHIIQDGGSDGIEEFAREVGADFYQDGVHIFEGKREAKYHIRVYSERDEGMYDALNRGLARGRGEICAWLNSDEQYLPGTLEYVASFFFQHQKTQVLLGDVVLLDRNLNPICYRRIMVPSRRHTQLVYLHSLSCSMFFRSDIIPDIPFDKSCRVVGDAILMNRWQSQGVNFEACKRLLSTYAFTGENLSSPASKISLEYVPEEMSKRIKFFRLFVIIQNWIRRFLHGAYGRFIVELNIFTFQSLKERVLIVRTLSGFWPQKRKN